MNEVEEPLWAEVREKGKGCRGRQRLTVPKTQNSQIVLVTTCTGLFVQEPATPLCGANSGLAVIAWSL